MKYLTLLFLIICFLFVSCSTLLLDEKTLLSFANFNNRSNEIVFYQKKFNFENDSSVTISTHKITKIGNNSKSLPPYLYTVDNSIDKLINFEARIYHKNSVSDKFNYNNLYSQNLSNKYLIAKQDIKFIPIEDKIKKGDLIESVTIHKRSLAMLGGRFSFDEMVFRAQNVSCIITADKDIKISYNLINDSTKPDIKIVDGKTTLIFKWPLFIPAHTKSIFESKFLNPILMVAIKNKDNKNPWQNFSNWYQRLIKSKLDYSQDIVNTTKKITKYLNTDKDKMEALFKFCQDKIRYEQVYLINGEFIPNDVNKIFKRQYADCKDYSCLMYVMAKSIGLNPKLALCYRGRGVPFFEDINISQFNHMIVYNTFNGKDYWYDATNRKGKPGITTFDLVNQKALIIDKNKSVIKTIKEDEENNLDIHADFKKKGKDFIVSFRIELKGQYAIDLIYGCTYINKAKFKEELLEWMKKYISKTVKINAINWDISNNHFLVNMDGIYKNGVLAMDGIIYVSMSKYLDNLIKIEELNASDKNQIFYDPDYSKISLDLSFDNLKIFNDTNSDSFRFNENIRLSQGPFNDLEDKGDFINKYNYYSKILNKNFKLVQKKP